jgi:hypothetical protein
MTKRTVLQIRLALCLDIAESLERHFGLANHPKYDAGEAALLIDGELPHTYDEASQEYEETRREEEGDAPAGPAKPSVLDELREALGFGADKKVSLVETIKAATERARALPELLAALRAVHAFFVQMVPCETGGETTLAVRLAPAGSFDVAKLVSDAIHKPEVRHLPGKGD